MNCNEYWKFLNHSNLIQVNFNSFVKSGCWHIFVRNGIKYFIYISFVHFYPGFALLTKEPKNFLRLDQIGFRIEVWDAFDECFDLTLGPPTRLYVPTRGCLHWLSGLLSFFDMFMLPDRWIWKFYLNSVSIHILFSDLRLRGISVVWLPPNFSSRTTKAGV